MLEFKVIQELKPNTEILEIIKSCAYLGYFEDEQAIENKIETLKIQNSTLKRYLSPIKNDEDNAN